ncbi:MAG TPA: hypothetical protein VF548_04360 [Allosphingosinicella sp.]
MPDFNPPPAGGPDGALAWYNRSLAKVLGLNPADPTLPADLLSELSSSAQRKALGAVIDRRFRRRVDEVSGAVTMEKVGGALALIEPDEDSDPEIAGMAAAYLGAAQAALASIDPSQAPPGKCPTATAAVVEQARATLAAVIAEAPVRRNRLQTIIHLDELTNMHDGLISELRKTFRTVSNNSPASIALERADKSIGLMLTMLEEFQKSMKKPCSGERPSLSDIAEVVTGCGAHVSTYARNVRTAFRAAGIGTCELRTVRLDCGAMDMGGQPIKFVTLDEGLQVLETELDRWSALIASGRQPGYANVKRSAERLKCLAEAIQSTSILQTLGIPCPSTTQPGPRDAFALSLAYQLDRLRRYTVAVVEVIMGDRPLYGWDEEEVETDSDALPNAPLEPMDKAARRTSSSGRASDPGQQGD